MAGASGSELELPLRRTDRAGEAFQVRPYAPADREALQRFYETFEPKRAAQGLPPAQPHRIAKWLDSVLPNGIHLVVERSGAIIGHALLVPMDAETLEYAIWMHQDVRNRGIGTIVNRVAIDVARESGYRAVWLSVEPANRPAVCSYLSAGFELVRSTVLSLEAEMVCRL